MHIADVSIVLLCQWCDEGENRRWSISYPNGELEEVAVTLFENNAVVGVAIFGNDGLGEAVTQALTGHEQRG